MTPTPLLPAYLWTGPHDSTIEHTVLFLQKTLCLSQGCGSCHTCLQISSQQHHAITWLTPDKNYTLDDLAVIFQTISFTVQPGEHHFFILQKADFLTLTCANSLLKSLEEPPTGYHFILLTERPDQILPTIKSRCITHTLYAPKKYTVHDALFACFTTTQTNAVEFLRILDQSKIDERDSLELLDRIVEHWIACYKKAVTASKSTIREMAVIDILKNGYDQLPMPGSSKLFWKNMYLQIQML